MKFSIGFAQVLDSDELLAIQGGQKLDTGINRPVTNFTIVQFADNHRTGATITFSTPFLGAVQPLVFAKILKNGSSRVAALNMVKFSLPSKAIFAGTWF